jgi:adenine phosphoribosyltransferase
MTLEQKIKSAMIDVHDFPKPGIVYKDITPIFQDPVLSHAILDQLVLTYQNAGIEAIVGLESRGFLFAMPLALRLGIPFVMIRKKGKLPRACHTVNYALEYGQSSIEIHTDALKPGQKVLIHDDVLATGGTAAAAAELVKMSQATVSGFSFLVELSFLKGEQNLTKFTDRIVTFARF